MANWIQPLTLVGSLVKLIPMTDAHAADMIKAASDGQLWDIWYTSVPSAQNITQYINHALAEQDSGKAAPFVVVDKATGNIVGSTRYCSVDAPNRRVEIGYTWYAKSTQRTGVNTECKFLLLRHAFETLDAIAVEFKTNFFNFPSRNAILRLGARQDGIIRNHRIDKMGNIRDTVLFSILNSEWPVVKTSLEFKMKQSYS